MVQDHRGHPLALHLSEAVLVVLDIVLDVLPLVPDQVHKEDHHLQRTSRRDVPQQEHHHLERKVANFVETISRINARVVMNATFITQNCVENLNPQENVLEAKNVNIFIILLL